MCRQAVEMGVKWFQFSLLCAPTPLLGDLAGTRRIQDFEQRERFLLCHAPAICRAAF